MNRAVLVVLAVLGMSNIASGANDPSIKGDLREEIQHAMSRHVADTAIGDKYVHYDPVEGQLLRLELQKLHSGIVKKGDYYVSCADFTAEDGTYYDLDFLVAGKPGNLDVYQAVVHKVEDDKREYHLED